MPADRHTDRAVGGFLSIGTLYSYLYCMLASNVVLSMPILGGTMYLAGRTGMLFFQLRRPLQAVVFPRSLKRIGTALLLVGAAILFALLFPLTRQHMEKLRRYTELRRNGQENAPLHDQLEAVVVRKSLRRYGIKVILFILRPLYYHKIEGRENIQLDEDTPCVFVCNHGEIYGPIVTNLYVPFSFRPWCTYEMLDKRAVAERAMQGAFQNAKGPWRSILNFLMHAIGAPLLVWLMKSVDAIPVYHDNPRKLMQTFRETIAAMEAGDNILIFPENAATSENQRYVKEGVSEFFTGFTMVGQLYNNKTGKCPLFVPLYANKRKRTITFGVPTRYNPDVNANEEKERLCAYLRGEMLRVAGNKVETNE